MLRVRVLGELRLERDGVPLDTPRRRPARALLGWLALNRGVHARSTVAGRLWPNVLDESARTSLRTALSALRAVVGADALIATRGDVGLSHDVVVDAVEFDQLLAQERPEDALDLYDGELLAGLDDDWVLIARDEYRERVAEALGSLGAAAVAHGDQERAIAFARRRAALDPLGEPAHRELMRLLADAGDRAAALATYERFAERLRRELGVAPSPPSRSLAAELRGPVVTAVPLPTPARVTAARRRGPLVGRDRELAKLHAAWADSARNGRQLVFVSGEPGIGKTRLVCEFAAELGALGVGVLYGRAEEEALVPYQPVVESLREALGHDVELRVPEAAGALPGARLRLFEEIGLMLDALAVGRSLMVVLDDLHWADLPTVRLIRYLAGRPSGAPQMLVATYRDTERHPLGDALAALYRELPLRRIALAGLDRDAVAALVGGDATPEEVRAMREQTGGNPFFIEQLLPGKRVGVVETVSRRISALGPEAHAVLDAAALSGAEFELAVVAEVVGLPVDQTLDVLDAAVKGRLISEVPDEPGRYAFVHAIVRETLVGALTAARCARLHELFAAALEGRAEREPDRYLVALANHSLEAAAAAGDPMRAADLAERAADRAGAVLAHEDAAALLRRAESALERRGGSRERQAELSCALGEALQRAGLGEEARTALARARKLARAAGRPDLIARAALGLGGAGVTILGTDPELVAGLEDALDVIGAEHPQLRVRLLARLAIELAYEHDEARREALSAEALALARKTDDPAALAAALNARHVTLWGPDGCDERLRLATEMLDLAEQAGDRELALQARNWRMVDLLEVGDGPAVRRELDAYADLSADVRLPAFAWYVPLWRATLALLDGRIAEGVELSRRARDLGRQAADANADVFFAEQYLLRMFVQGRMRDLNPSVDGLEGDVGERAQRGPAWRSYRFTFAWWHAERGELDEARVDFEAAIADGLHTLPRDVNWLAALSSAAHASVLLGDVDRALELRALLEPYATRMVVTARGASHGGSVAYLLARLAAICGDHPAADEMFRDAARRDEHVGATALVVRDLRDHGEFLREAGRNSDADTLLRSAAEKAGSLEFEVLGDDDRERTQSDQPVLAGADDRLEA